MGYELPMLHSCCCGCSLRTGSKIIGWMYLICGILFSGTYVVFLFIEEEKASPEVALSLMIMEATATILQTVSSFLLLLGAYQGKRIWVWWWIVANTIVVIINTCILIAYLFLGSISFSTANILAMIIELYFVLVVYSYYRDMADSSSFSV